MSREPLLSAKLAVVPTPGAVVLPRPRLFRLLDAGTAGPVTLVSASAGWGKTMLLSSWYQARSGAAGRSGGGAAGHRSTSGAVADQPNGGADGHGTTGAGRSQLGWLSVEPGDGGARLWTYLSAALRPPHSEDVGDGRDDRGTGYGLPHLAEELAGRDVPVTLVLDDLHQVDDPEVVEGLEFLLRHAAGRLRLVIGCRTDPGLALHRWRLSGELTEIRAADLAFRPDEVAELFAAYGVPLSADETHGLWGRTEGWAAGLRFAALARSGHPDPERFVEEFTGEHPDVAGYLTEELLASLSVEAREALCRASLTTAFSADLISALADPASDDRADGGRADGGRVDGGRLLGELDRHGGFVVPLGGRPPTYRIHPMVAQLLRAELARRPAAERAGLHRRAAVWSAAHDLPGEALRHALAGADWRYASTILLRHWPDLIPYGQTGPARTTPPPPAPEVLRATPELALACAADRLDARDPVSTSGYLDLAADLTGRLDDEARRYRLGRIGVALRLASAQATGDLATVEAETAGLLDLHRIYPDRPGGAGLTADDPGADPNRVATGADPGRAATGDGRIGVATIDVPGVAPERFALDRAEVAVARLVRAGTRLGTGDLDIEAELVDGLADAEAAGLSRAGRLCLGRLALVQALRGELRAADQTARTAMAGGPFGVPTRPADGVHAHLAQALVALQRDRTDEADLKLSLAARAAEYVDEPLVVVLLGLLRSRVLRDRGDLGRAHQMLDGARRQLTEWRPDLRRPGSRRDCRPAPAHADDGVTFVRPGARGAVERPDGRATAAAAAGVGVGVGARAAAAAGPGGERLLAYWLLAGEAELRTAHGDLESARNLLLPAVEAGVEPVAPLAVVLSRTYLRAGDPQAALRTLPDWDAETATDWPLALRLEAGLLDAGAARLAGDRRRATRVLERVLELAEPEGFRRVFTRADPSVRELLSTHLDSGTGYWATVSELIGASGTVTGRPSPAVPAMGEPLTDRELTVLRYLQSILSNVEIAAEMSLSVNTVKTHVRNIYRKLDATRRRDAVRRARELRLL
ncbi:LuxR C-terminal-related transcriptional regulator [Plantactinospora sp. B24E8]|uniref:helix-turn-helix transcriptional regulator n=1 Tax=Plantactinospora sp. B24E8 TaxID=3153567 RepID=UPI00325CAF0B